MTFDQGIDYQHTDHDAGTLVGPIALARQRHLTITTIIITIIIITIIIITITIIIITIIINIIIISIIIMVECQLVAVWVVSQSG